MVDHFSKSSHWKNSLAIYSGQNATKSSHRKNSLYNYFGRNQSCSSHWKNSLYNYSGRSKTTQAIGKTPFIIILVEIKAVQAIGTNPFIIIFRSKWKQLKPSELSPLQEIYCRNQTKLFFGLTPLLKISVEQFGKSNHWIYLLMKYFVEIKLNSSLDSRLY